MSMESQNNSTTGQNTSNKPFIRYDDYWLQKGRDMIEGSIETLSKRLTNLDNFLTYLAAGTFLSGISIATLLESTNIGVYGLVAIPLIFIGIAKYAISVGGTAPALETTDMRSPTQINENYAQVLNKLSKQVKKSSQWVAVATGFTLALLPFAVYFHNCDKEIEHPKTYLSIQNDGSNLSLQGILPGAENVSLALYGKDAKKQPRVPIYGNLLLKEPGQLNATIDLKSNNIVLDSLDVYYTIKKEKKMYRYKTLQTSSKKASVKKKPAKKPVIDSLKTEASR